MQAKKETTTKTVDGESLKENKVDIQYLSKRRCNLIPNADYISLTRSTYNQLYYYSLLTVIL
jgi:hypothetical protein